MRTYTVRPLQVTCPRCYVGQWESCVNGDGYRTFGLYHYAREVKAERYNIALRLKRWKAGPLK